MRWLALSGVWGCIIMAVSALAGWIVGTFPGWGGQQPPPQNASPAGQLTPGVTPGVTGQIVASRVIIIGTGGEILIYSPSAGSGNLVLSGAASTTTDSFGDTVLGGFAAYTPTQTVQLTAGSLVFNAVPAGSAGGTIAANGSGIILMNSGLITGLDNSSQMALESQSASGVTGGLLSILAGQVTISGTLSVNGSTSTGTTGLPDGTIHGTSGGASAGTAHTHGPGSFAVGNGMHSHVL